MKHARLTHLTSEEYLASENDNPAKHEYVAGQLHAMVGVRDTHNAIALNVASQLRSTLRGGPCRVFMSDVKVRVEEADAFYYPDVFVTCDARDTDPYVKRYPSLVIATEAIDRREKLLNYRKLPSLHEYVLIGSAQRWIEIYRLEADGSWTVATLEGDEDLELSARRWTLCRAIP
ncbi:MAG: Uma2 family endonuclease [Gammaproteobacteria bacterium]